ncbi:MAG: hypothetical protein ABFE13_12685 [Phycisphaerales bacterium]
MCRGRLTGILVGVSSGGLFVLACVLTPEFIERHLSPDGHIFDQTRRVMAIWRVGMACTAVLVATLWIVRKPLIRHFSRYAVHRGQSPSEMLSAHDLMGTPQLGWPEKVLWVVLPAWLVVVDVSFLFQIQWPRFLLDEYGVIENGTALLYLIGGVFALTESFRRRGRDMPVGFQRWWLLLLGVFCLFVAGEEVNWGQTYFHFRTPEVMTRLNYQQQFSLHNIWFPAHLPLPQGNWDHMLGQMLCLTGAVGPWLLCVSRRLRCLVWTWEIPIPPLLSQGYFAAGVLMPTDAVLFGYQMRPTEMREFSMAVAFTVWIFSERNRRRLYTNADPAERRDPPAGAIPHDR